MPITAKCPKCGKTGTVPDNAAGKQATCPGCKERFVLPALDGPLPLPAPAEVPVEPLEPEVPVVSQVPEEDLDEAFEAVDELPPAKAMVVYRDPEPPRKKRRRRLDLNDDDNDELPQRRRSSRCPHASTSTSKAIAPAGWLVFGGLLTMGMGFCVAGLCFFPLWLGPLVLFPLSFVGLLITADVRTCNDCGASV